MGASPAPVLKLTLRTDWDIPVNLPITGEETRGHFAGRKSELAALTNEFIRRTNGAILISGHRGAGKTSLVHKALNDARRCSSTILPILVNAGQIKGDSEPKCLIEAIVRRLYSTAQATAEAYQLNPSNDRKFPEQLLKPIDSLYRKCVAVDFKLVESMTAANEKSDASVREDSSEHTVDLPKLLAVVTGFLFAGATAIVPWTPSAPIRSLAALFVAATSSFASSVAIRTKTTASRNTTTQLSAKQLYEFDNKVGNLEFDLEIIHRKAMTHKWKLIYVIDELDKLDVKEVERVIEVCKNLFTLSDAVFVFLGDERLYGMGEVANGKIYERGKEYTYFNSRYYIGPPTTEELDQFVDDVIQTKECNGGEGLLESLRDCLFFEARNDFFDLITAIRGRITGFDGDVPVITISDDRLADEDIQKARFNICISSLSEKYFSTSVTKWRQNAELSKLGYSNALKILGLAGTEVQAPTAQSVSDRFVRDLYSLLCKFGALNSPHNRPVHNRANNAFEQVYPVNGTITSDPPRKLAILTEFERNFLSIFDRCFAYLVAIANLHRRNMHGEDLTLDEVSKNPEPVCNQIQQWGFDPRSVLSNHLSRYQRLRDEPPPYEERVDVVDKATDELKNGIETLCAHLPQILATIAFSFLDDKEFRLVPHQGYNNQLHGPAGALGVQFASHRPWMIINTSGTKQAVYSVDTAKELIVKEAQIPSKDVCQLVCVVRKPAEGIPNKVTVVRCGDEVELFTSAMQATDSVLNFLQARTESQPAA